VKAEAARRLARAERFLAQAEEFPADKAPEAIIHLSYYAMLHAAAAVLVERSGRAPKTHGAIIGQFANVTKADEREGRALSRSFNHAQNIRLASDYGDENSTTSEAAETREAARAFVAFCRTLL
jgi:uncharacterized protein (UPF0332 family)